MILITYFCIVSEYRISISNIFVILQTGTVPFKIFLTIEASKTRIKTSHQFHNSYTLKQKVAWDFWAWIFYRVVMDPVHFFTRSGSGSISLRNIFRSLKFLQIFYLCWFLHEKRKNVSENLNKLKLLWLIIT